jgi:signal transduction histidine kinase
MSGTFWLDWAILAASLFNTILLVWLGLTVLLNADRRNWGVWLMGGGLLAGASFFVSHSAILGQELAMNLDGLNFWWRAGWFPITVSPFAWYVATLWFSGFWQTPASIALRRHRFWLCLMSLWFAALIVLLAANPVPAYEQVVQLDLSGMLAIRNIPLLLLLFPLWMITCIVLSIDALPRVAPIHGSSTQLGADANTQLARRRARPWLLGTAGALLAVSLVVGYFMVTVVTTVATGGLAALSVQRVALFDLVLSLLIALSLLLVGQAVVSYEIFTGRVLPRRSFVRHWRNAIVLAAGFALVVGWSIVIDLRPIYTLLLAMLLLTLFYALYSWRTFSEREQFVERLRPFVQSQGIAPDALHAAQSAASLLAALCRDVLGTANALLIPLGSMAPLVTTTLRFPPATDVTLMQPPRDLNAGMTLLDVEQFSPYEWAISLWDERGRIGALLVGEKLDGGLYSQEEMETAQAAGERIVQLLAGEQMVRRLMELQRKRTTEQRVMDLRTRRVLHDDVLPSLHLAALQLSGADRSQPAIQEALATLAETHQQIAALLTNTQRTPARPPDPCELGHALHALVEGEFAHSFDEIRWRTFEASKTVYVDEVVGEVVLGAAREIMRNAASHGRGSHANRPLCLEITLCAATKEEGEILLAFADNGVGMETSRRTQSQGSGNGLALHSTLLAMVGGYLTIESPPAGGTVVRVALPAPIRTPTLETQLDT